MDVQPKQQDEQLEKQNEEKKEVSIGFEGVNPPSYTSADAELFLKKMKEDAKMTENTTPAEAENSEEKVEEPNEIKILFTDKSIRRAFARKVFTILALLLLKTVLYSALCVYYQPFRKFWKDNLLFIFCGMPVYVVTAIIIICCPSARKTSPWNYILLLMFSSSTAFMIGGICAVFQEESVVIAFGMTTILVLGLAFFAVQTKWDFTGWKMFAFSSILILVLTIVSSLSYLSIGGRIAISGLLIFVFSICLICDIQLIISGDHRYKISPEEHILAVIILYLDIINLFLAILRNMR